MVKFASEGGADLIVVQFLDRLGRNPKEILRRIWALQECGVTVVATDEDIQEELILLIKAGIAGAESRRTSERVRAYMARSVEKGVHAARPPFGLRRNRTVGEGGNVSVTWELHPDESVTVREMVRLATEENLGFKSVADHLNAEGHKSRTGAPFSSHTIYVVLNNPAIAGTLRYGRKPRKGNPQQEIVEVADFFPATISQEEWDRLQERLAIRRESPRGQAHASVYILTGIARCGHCGGPLTGKVGMAYKGKRYRNYWCSRSLRSKAFCGIANGHSAPKLESAVIEYLGQFTDPDKVKEMVAEADAEATDKAAADLKRAQRRLTELESDFDQHLELLKRGTLNEAEFNRANNSARSEAAKLEERKQELESRLAQEQNRAAMEAKVPAQVGSFLEDFQHLGPRRQKAQLQIILKAIHVWNDGRIELEFRP